MVNIIEVDSYLRCQVREATENTFFCDQRPGPINTFCSVVDTGHTCLHIRELAERISEASIPGTRVKLLADTDSSRVNFNVDRTNLPDTSMFQVDRGQVCHYDKTIEAKIFPDPQLSVLLDRLRPFYESTE